MVALVTSLLALYRYRHQLAKHGALDGRWSVTQRGASCSSVAGARTAHRGHRHTLLTVLTTRDKHARPHESLERHKGRPGIHLRSRFRVRFRFVILDL